MELLAVVEPKLLYSKFAERGIRPDARLASQSRNLTLLPNSVAVPNGVSCIATIGRTTVLVTSTVMEAEVMEYGVHSPLCRVRVQVPAVAAGAAAHGIGTVGESGALLQRELGEMFGSAVIASRNAGTEPGVQILVNIDVLPLCDDGGLADAATAAVTVALSRTLMSDGTSALRLCRWPVSCTVAVISHGSVGQWHVIDPSLSNGEGMSGGGVARSGFALTAPASGAIGKMCMSTGPTAVASVPSRSTFTGSAGQDFEHISAGLAEGSVRVTLNANAPAGAIEVLAVRIVQNAPGLSMCPLSAVADAKAGAAARAEALLKACGL